MLCKLRILHTSYLYQKCGCCILGYQVPSHLALSGLSPRQVMTPKGPATPTSPAAWPDVFHPSESYGPCLLSFLAMCLCFSLCMCQESSLSISLLCAMYIHVFEICCAQQFQMLFLTPSWVWTQGIHGFQQIPTRYSFGQSLAVPVAWSSPRTPRHTAPARQSFTAFWLQRSWGLHSGLHNGI